jgi:cytochrome P450
VINDFELGGYRIPAGANIVMSQWIMHRDPRFFSDPERFLPDRWSNENVQKLPRFAYFTFGGGPRQCIGSSFAMMEAMLLLATIASRYQLAKAEGTPVIPVPSFTLRPKGGIYVALKKRR